MKKLRIRTAAVLGAGTMGAGIAALLAGNGVKVILLDMPAKEGPRNSLAEAGLKNIQNPKSRLLCAPGAAQLITTGNFEDDLEKLKSADWVVEAIVEKLEPKVELLSKTAAVVKEDCILSSNTSGISMKAISAGLPEAQRPYFIGTHFFNPPRYMQLLELIPTDSTDPAIVSTMETFGEERLGRSVIIARDTPSFIANRIGNANAQFLFHGMERFGLPVSTVNMLAGKLIGRAPAMKTFDLVGLDVVQASCNTNFEAEQDIYEKNLMASSPAFQDLIDRKHLGDKSGMGFFRKEGDSLLEWDWKSKKYIPAMSPRIPELDALGAKASMREKIYALLDSETAEGGFLWFLLSELFTYSANRVPEIASDFRKIDLAMHLGYNWRFGPFELWDALNAGEILRRLQRDGKRAAAWVEPHLKKNGGKFYSDIGFASLAPSRLSLNDRRLPVVWESDEVLLKDLGNGVGAVVIVTRNSTLGTRATANMITAVRKAEELFDAAVIGSAGKNFCVGADLDDMLADARSGKFDVLTSNTHRFQEMTQAIKYASIPFVAAAFGNALGGGCEICMQAHKVVSHSELTIGLVEPQVGLIPSGGGLKELVLRASELEARHPDLYLLPFIEQYVGLISNGKVSSSALHARELGLLRETDRIVPKFEMLIEAAKEEAALLAKSFTPLAERQLRVFGRSGFASISAKWNNRLLGGFISAYDKVIADKVAWVLTGGNVPDKTVLSEADLLELECQAFVWLTRQQKTQERMEGLLKTGKMIHN